MTIILPSTFSKKVLVAKNQALLKQNLKTPSKGRFKESKINNFKHYKLCIEPDKEHKVHTASKMFNLF